MFAFFYHEKATLENSGAGPGMFIPDPDFFPSQISDSTTTTKEEVPKNLLSYFFVAINFIKLYGNYLNF